MRAINHALTGAIIGLAVGEPIVAIPAALVSHFVCDVIPHYDSDEPQVKKLQSPLFRNLLLGDALLCVSLVLILGVQRPEHWLLASICAFAATSPDLIFVNRYLNALRGKKQSLGRFVRLTIKIQWFQHPIGAVVEIAWFVGAIILLLPFIR